MHIQFFKCKPREASVLSTLYCEQYQLFQRMEFDFTHRLLSLESMLFHFWCWLVCFYLREVCEPSCNNCLLEPTHSLCSRAIGRFLWKPSHPACQCVRVCVCTQAVRESQKCICCPVMISYLPLKTLTGCVLLSFALS